MVQDAVSHFNGHFQRSTCLSNLRRLAARSARYTNPLLDIKKYARVG